MKNFAPRSALILTLLLALSACRSGGSSDPLYGAWYDAFGQVCGYSPGPGCDYASNGFKIMIYQDPFYSMYLTDYSGFGFWMSPSGIIYDPSGFAINADRSFDEPMDDVITLAANQKKNRLNAAAHQLSSEYGLESDRALRIAEALQEWAMIGKTRTRTSADLDDFSKRLFGVDSTKIRAAIAVAEVSGQSDSFSALIPEVADHWATTPETASKILKKWYQGELTRF